MGGFANMALQDQTSMPAWHIPEAAHPCLAIDPPPSAVNIAPFEAAAAIRLYGAPSSPLVVKEYQQDYPPSVRRRPLRPR